MPVWYTDLMVPQNGREQHQTLFAALHGLIEVEGEYLSHQTALFLLGQIQDTPPVLTIVSPRRRRPREVEGRALNFICLPPEKLRPQQQVAFGELTLAVSTLEKTLIDLVGYLDYAPPLEDLVRLFATLPVSPSLLIHLARQASDTVLKRVSFILACTGRAAWSDIPFEAITRTPVKLDTRREGPCSLWDSRFNLRYPKWLLEFPIPEPIEEISDELRDWIELRRFPPFVKLLSREGQLFLREDPHPKAKARLDGFFEETLVSLDRESLDKFLLHHLDRLYGIRNKRPFPALLSQWVDGDPQRLEPHHEMIRDWVRRHLHSDSPVRVDAALFFGRLLGENEAVLKAVSRQGLDLLSAGRERVIALLADDYLEFAGELPCPVYAVMARSFARRGRADQAIEILERGKSVMEGPDHSPSELGELAHTAGVLFGRMGKFEIALSEMLLARECFAVAQDHRGLGMVDFATGNLYYSRGLMTEARGYYLQALGTLRTHGTRENQANILGNLGLVEYDAGCFRKAVQCFTQAIAMPQPKGNAWGKSIIMLARAKAWLQMGQLTKAMKGFQETFKLKKELRHAIGICETAAMLSWTCELLGQDGAAQAWWEIADDEKAMENEPRALYLLKSLRAMSCLFGGDLEKALARYREVFSYVENASFSLVARGGALHGLGCCLSLLGQSEAVAVLAEARTYLGSGTGRPPYYLLNIFCATHHPEAFPEIDLPDAIRRFLASQAFDPFWAWSAAKMIDHPEPAVHEFLDWHYRRTPPSTLEVMGACVPGFKSLIGNMRKGHQRAAEFLSLIGPRGAHPIHLEEYEQWQKGRLRSAFRFDGRRGILQYADRSTEIKAGSLSHGILSNLLLAWPHPVEVEILFRTVWGTAFDPEIDPAALKSAFGRLRRLLKSVCPGISLRRKASKGTTGHVLITLSCPWEAVL